MNIQNIITGICLILGFVVCIIPTSNFGKKVLEANHNKAQKDLEKWRRRQQILDQVEKHVPRTQ